MPATALCIAGSGFLFSSPPDWPPALASIIHFQILGAVAFFFLMAVCWGFAGGIAGTEN
jgi:hypothetical protein